MGADTFELVFDLYPTANLFEAGHRMRLTITCAERDNNQMLQANSVPELIVYRNAERPSRMLLPVNKP